MKIKALLAVAILSLATPLAVNGAASENSISGFTVSEVKEIMKKYSPEWAGSVSSEELEATIRSVASSQAPGGTGGILNPDQWAEMKIFFDQVLPLFSYQMKNRVEPDTVPAGTYSVEQIYQAPKDACHYGIGDARNTYNPMGIDCEACTAAGGKLKASGSYAWGMVEAGGKLYWSTNNNYLCMPGYGAVATGGKTGPYENSCWVCEYEKGVRGAEVGVYGDIVPPRIYEYDLQSGVVKDITPDEPLLGTCQGLRSATCHKGVIFFGGPSIKGGSSTASASSCFLAYSLAKGQFIGSSDMASVDGCQITNVRRWLVIDDVLYCGVGLIDKEGVARGGILRWRGSEADPFNFEIVGYVTGDAAELCYHKGRMYVGAWPSKLSCTSIFRSPQVPVGGFTKDHAVEWEQVWKYDQYEINQSTIGVTYLSAIRSYKGRLYWGMFGNTYGVLYSAIMKYGSIKSAKALAWICGALRSTTLWTSEDFTTPQDVELLYGESELPKYDATSDSWALYPNASGYVPRYGRSGYGNIFTCYTWVMTEYNGKLYAGTMDMSDLIAPAMESMGTGTETTPPAAAPGGGNGGNGGGNGNGGGTGDGTGTKPLFDWQSIIDAMLLQSQKNQGYECLVIEDYNKPLKMVTANGFGNPAAYGIRNMVPSGNSLFIGTANPLNLHPQGGWQIMKLTENGQGGVDEMKVQPATIIYRQGDGFVIISSLTGEEISKVEVFDMKGKMVSSEKTGEPTAYIFTTDMSKGIYVVNVETKTTKRAFKIAVR